MRSILDGVLVTGAIFGGFKLLKYLIKLWENLLKLRFDPIIDGDNLTHILIQLDKIGVYKTFYKFKQMKLSNFMYIFICHGPKKESPGWRWFYVEACKDLSEEVLIEGHNSFQAFPLKNWSGSLRRSSSYEKSIWFFIQLMFWEEVGALGTQVIFETFL